MYKWFIKCIYFWLAFAFVFGLLLPVAFLVVFSVASTLFGG